MEIQRKKIQDVIAVIVITTILVVGLIYLPVLVGREAFQETGEIFWGVYIAFMYSLLFFGGAGFILFGCLGLALSSLMEMDLTKNSLQATPRVAE